MWRQAQQHKLESDPSFQLKGLTETETRKLGRLLRSRWGSIIVARVFYISGLLYLIGNLWYRLETGAGLGPGAFFTFIPGLVWVAVGLRCVGDNRRRRILERVVEVARGPR